MSKLCGNSIASGPGTCSRHEKICSEIATEAVFSDSHHSSLTCMLASCLLETCDHTIILSFYIIFTRVPCSKFNVGTGMPGCSYATGKEMKPKIMPSILSHALPTQCTIVLSPDPPPKRKKSSHLKG